MLQWNHYNINTPQNVNSRFVFVVAYQNKQIYELIFHIALAVRKIINYEKKLARKKKRSIYDFI